MGMFDNWSWEEAAKGAVGGGGLAGIWAGLKGGNQGNPAMRGFSAMQGGMGPAGQAAYSDFRTNQTDLVRRLEAMSRGEGPSLAQKQLEAATDRGQKQQQSMAAGMSGPNAGMAQFNAANNMAGISAQAGQDAAAARIAEQFNAMNQLGLTLHGARGADEGMNRFNVSEANNRDAQNWQAQFQALSAMDQINSRPTLGDQLFAGGMNALGMAAGGSMGGQGGGGSPMMRQGPPPPGQPPIPYGSAYPTGWNNWTEAARGGPVNPWEQAQPNQPGWAQTPWNQPGMRL